MSLNNMISLGFPLLVMLSALVGQSHQTFNVAKQKTECSGSLTVIDNKGSKHEYPIEPDTKYISLPYRMQIKEVNNFGSCCFKLTSKKQEDSKSVAVITSPGTTSLNLRSRVFAIHKIDCQLKPQPRASYAGVDVVPLSILGVVGLVALVVVIAYISWCKRRGFRGVPTNEATDSPDGLEAETELNDGPLKV